MPKDIEFILKNFVRHVTELKAEDDPAGTGFHREFRVLREEQIQNKNEDRFPTEYGRREENLKKNRYKDILPRDDRRVKLTEIEGEKGSDYINASFIEDVNGKNGYIAAQGPMPHTVNDFWRMLWQYNTEIVFMACRVKEDGRPKCEKYWPDEGENVTHGDITVYTDSEEEIQDHFVRRQLRAEKDGETHTLTHFHYVGWPDHNTPSSPDALRTMIEHVRNYRKHLDIPMVVHCSAGCGRTGTICAIDFAWTLLDRGMIKEEFSMFEIIKSMREQRMSMVQTPDQYEYTHMVMKSLCSEWLASFSNHDYENVFIGRPPSDEVDEVDDVDETYANVDFGNEDDQENCETGESTEKAVEKVVIIPELPRKVETMVASAPPAAEDLAQATKQESKEEKKPKPKAAPRKPQVGDTIQSTPSSRPATMVIAESKQNDAGEYVEVKRTASQPPPLTVTHKTPASNPSAEVRTKTSSTSSTDNADPCKTVIKVGGGSATPQIIKSGSVGLSHTKQQAPRPPAAQAVVRPMVVTGQHQQEQQAQQQQGRVQQTAANNVGHGEVVKIKPITNRPTSFTEYEDTEVFNTSFSSAASFTAYEDTEVFSTTISSAENEHQNSTSQDGGNSVVDSEDAPDLPSRNYKPEEIHSPTTTTTTHKFPDPVTTTTTTTCASTTQKPKSPTSSTPPAVDMIRGRPPQPLPVTQTPASSVQASGIQVVGARPATQVANVRPQEQMVGPRPIPAGLHTQPVQGVVSAMGGGPQQHPQQVLMGRRGDGKSDTRSLGYPTQPVMTHSHGKGPAPRGPMMVHHSHLSGVKAHHAPVTVGGQQVVAKTTIGGKVMYLTERPARARGPRNMPPEWAKNHRGGTYL